MENGNGILMGATGNVEIKLLRIASSTPQIQSPYGGTPVKFRNNSTQKTFDKGGEALCIS